MGGAIRRPSLPLSGEVRNRLSRAHIGAVPGYSLRRYCFEGRTHSIAEEVVDIIPELVTLDSEGLPEAVNYDRFVSVLTKAFQEAVAKIETLEAKVAALESA